MRALVTGAGGFVGRYLCGALREEGADVLACGGPHDAGVACTIDVRELTTLQSALQSFRPTVIFHLAAQAFVPDAVAAPIETYEINALGTARLTAAIREYTAGPPPRLVFASSAEVYGVREPAEYPLDERLDCRPRNPYGGSKAAAEAILTGEAQSLGLDAVIARGFNQIGPGQNERFVVASFAAQLARIAAGGPPQLFVGNVEAARDFIDVRDAVRGYIALARDGERGEIYNVCSGRAVTIRDILRELIGIARVPVEVREDPQRVRTVEMPLSVGNPAKLRARTGWSPQIPLLRSLRDVYEQA